MQLSLLSLIYLITCSHAVMLAVALWHQTKKGHSGRLLSIVLAILAYKLFEGGVFYSNLYEFVPHAYDLLPGAVLWIGPIFYGYVRVISGKPGFSWLQWLLHFIPGSLILIRNLPYVLIPAEQKIAAISRFHEFEGVFKVPLVGILLLIAIKIHLAIYLWLSWTNLQRLESTAKNLRSDHSVLTISKLKVFCQALCALEATWVALFLMQQLGGIQALNIFSEVWLLFIAVIVLTWGYCGLKQPNISFSSLELSLVSAAEPAQQPAEIHPDNRDVKTQKQAASTIDDSTAAEVKALLERLMHEQQLYLDDKLTLSSLAEALQIKPHLLSGVINQNMQTSFYKLVNKYRVEHAMGLLKDDSNKWSIERVALESGFGNRVTFNKSFKEITGTTASAYKKSAAHQ